MYVGGRKSIDWRQGEALTRFPPPCSVGQNIIPTTKLWVFVPYCGIISFHFIYDCMLDCHMPAFCSFTLHEEFAICVVSHFLPCKQHPGMQRCYLTMLTRTAFKISRRVSRIPVLSIVRQEHQYSIMYELYFVFVICNLYFWIWWDLNEDISHSTVLAESCKG